MIVNDEHKSRVFRHGAVGDCCEYGGMQDEQTYIFPMAGIKHADQLKSAIIEIIERTTFLFGIYLNSIERSFMFGVVDGARKGQIMSRIMFTFLLWMY